MSWTLGTNSGKQVADISWQYRTRYSPHRPQFAGEKIPTLQEAIDLCIELDLLLFVDVKSNRLRVSGQRVRYDYLMCPLALGPGKGVSGDCSVIFGTNTSAIFA